MRNFCEKHQLGFTGNRCPQCEKERIASFKVSKTHKTTPGLAPREMYFDEYRPKSNNDIVVVLDYDEQIVPHKHKTISDSDMEAMLLEKFGKVSKI